MTSLKRAKSGPVKVLDIIFIVVQLIVLYAGKSPLETL